MHLKSHRKFPSAAAFILTSLGFVLTLMLVSASPAFALETVTTFESTCTTPQTVFQLGDTVCAKVENVAGGDLNQIWLQWVAPDGTVAFGSAGTTVVTTDGQTFTQVLPTTGANAQQGRWQARTANVTGGAVRGPFAAFRVPRMSVIGVRRDTPGSVFYFRNSNTTGIGEGTVPFGIPGDVGLMGDWDGDGVVTPGVYRQSDNTFYLSNSPVGANADVVFQFGPTSGNPRTPLVGDWDGDGVTTVGIHQDDMFYLRNSNSAGPADLTFVFGIAGDLPLAGDWNADGTTTVGVYRTGAFFLRNSNSSGPADLQFGYGILGDLPITGDWNADGTTTIGVYRSNPGESAFYLKNSNDESNGGAADVVLGFGVPNDQPLVHVHNEAPVVTAGGTLPYTESDPATAIEPALTLTDMDSAILVGATAQITGNCASGEDVLSFADQNGITGNYTAASCLMTLSGRASVANYRTALQSVKYNNTSTTPSTLPRTVTWLVNDGAVVNHLSAPVTSTINVTAKASQTINFTSVPPGGAVVGGPTYTVTATGGGSGNPVTFTIDATAASVCSIVGSTVSFTAIGTCVIDANQAGSPTFEPAPQVQQSFAVGQGSQTINFTSSPSSPVVGGPTYTVTATGGASGNAVTFTIDASATSVCSIAGSTVSFTAVGTCVIDANQAGDANYNAAPQVQQSFAVGKGSQTINFTSTAPTDAKVGGPTYTVTATGGASGNAVTFTIDAVATNMCSIAGSTVSFGPNPGTCVIDANQLGSANYNAAPQVQQSFLVHQAPAITSNNTTTFTVGQANTFSVTTTGTPTVTSIVMASVTPGPGGTLPSGVNFTYVSGANGTLAGNPSNAAQVGTYVVSFTASNGTPPDAVQNPFTLTVVCPAITLGPANNSIFTATYNVLFTQAFTPSGGTGPYTYTLGGAALPNVAFSGNNLTGTPNNTGSFAFTVQAVDAKGCTSPNQSYTLNVNPSVTNDTYPTSVIGNVFVDSTTVPYSVVTNDSFPAGTASISAFDATGTLGGTMSMTTSGADVGKFTYDPPRGKTGSDVFNYTLSSNSRTASGTVSITVANKIWFINSVAGACPGAPCDGRQSHPYTDASTFSTANTGAVPAPQDGDPIFIYSGSGYLGPLTLRNNQKVLGQGAGISLASFTGFTAGSGQSLPTTGGTFPSITTSAASTNAVNLGGGTGNTLRGFNIGNTTGSKISGSSFGTLTTSEMTLSGSGQALNLTTGTLSGSLTGTTSTSGTNNVMLSGVQTSGTYDLASGVLSGATGDALLISGQNGSFTYSGTITSGSAHSVNVTGKTGGTVALSGAITDNDTGISLTTNTGATINLTGGLSLSTTTNAAFTATGGGTVNVTGANNTITTTTGVGVNIANTTIGGSGVTFKTISVNGAANGIVLNTTGAGSFTVTGDGASDPANTTRGRTTAKNGGGTITLGSGGTIQNTTGAAINLNSATNVTLQNLSLTGNSGGVNSGADGVHATSVTGLTLDNVLITGHLGNDGLFGSTVSNLNLLHADVHTNAKTAGVEALDIWNVRLDNLTGTCAVTNSLFFDTVEDVFTITNNGSSNLTLTVTNSEFRDTSLTTAPAVGNTTFSMLASGSAVTTLTATGSTFKNARLTAFQYAGNNTSSGTIKVLNSVFGGTPAGGDAASQNGVDIDIAHQGQGTTLNFEVSGNTTRQGFRANDSTSINIFLGGLSTATSVLSGSVKNNTIGIAGTANSGSDLGAGIALDATGAGTLTATVTGNIVNQVRANSGNVFDAGTSQTAKLNLLIHTNTFNGNPAQLNPQYGIHINAGTGTPGETNQLCIDMDNNTVAMPASAIASIDLDSFPGTSTNLVGYTGAANNGTQIQNFFGSSPGTTPPGVNTATSPATLYTAAGGSTQAGSCSVTFPP